MLLGIYRVLEKLKFPPLASRDLDSDEEEEIELTANAIFAKIGKYIQGGDSRLFLLEWLVCNISEAILPRGKFSRENRVQSTYSNMQISRVRYLCLASYRFRSIRRTLTTTGMSRACWVPKVASNRSRECAILYDKAWKTGRRITTTRNLLACYGDCAKTNSSLSIRHTIRFP